MGHGAANVFANLVQRLLIFAENLDGDLGVNARDKFVVASLDYLREIEFNAREWHRRRRFSLDTLAHGIDQFIFGFGSRPLALGFEAHVDLVVADTLRVAAQIRSA